MMGRIRTYWAERSIREQWMLGVMFALLGTTILWFGIIAPLGRAQRTSRDALLEATDRNAAIRAAVRQLKALPRQAASGLAVPIDQYIGQSAGDAGLTLERAQVQGDDRIDIAITSVRPTALFSWIAALEAQGTRVETLTVRPSGTAGSLSLQAVLVRGGGR